MAKYADNAVFLPGRGAVLTGEVGIGVPIIADVEKWIADGALNSLKAGLSAYQPIGHTSIDELPKIDSDIEGGEVKGSWENPALRQTGIKSTDSITVTPIQWTEEALKHRFGAGGVVDKTKGTFTIPDVYTASEVSLLIVIIDSAGPLVLQFNKAVSAPEGGIDPDVENFLGIPTKYTILNPTGKPRGHVMHRGLIEVV